MQTCLRRKRWGAIPQRLWLMLLALTAMIGVFLTPNQMLADAPAVKGYADYEVHAKQVAQIAASKWAEVRVLAKTRGNRDVQLLTIGQPKGRQQRKAILIVGNVHEPHLAGSELAFRLAKQIVDRAEKNDKAIAALLNQYTLFIIPRPNPDGSEAFFQRPHFERAGNLRPTDDDRDGEVGEDPYNDLNGDGVITMMRIEDPAGEWIEHPDDPRVLIKADKKRNERGKYRVMSEGIDDDHDGEFNEDNSVGVSFNRNFTFKYPYFKPGAGPHQVSEPETRAVADFVFSKPNIAYVFTFSPQDNLFHAQGGAWKPTGNSDKARIKTNLHSKDGSHQNALAELFRKSHEGKDAPSAAGGEGSFSEWAYFHYGRWSFASQGWWVPKVEPKKDQAPKDKRGSGDLNKLRWLEANKLDGFVDWTSVKHPDFPGQKVEVGGFKPYIILNPPVKELDAIAGKHVTFLQKLTDLRPKLIIRKVKVESLGEGVFRVTPTVVNDGQLPTMSEMGRITRKLQGVQLELTLPKGAKLITGNVRTSIKVLAGHGGSDEKTWLIHAPVSGHLKLRAWSPLVGTVTKSVSLKEGK